MSFDRDEARLTDRVELGSLTGQAARLIEAAVLAGLNIVVAAGTWAGNPHYSQNTLLERPHHADDRAPSGAAIGYLLPIRARVATAALPCLAPGFGLTQLRVEDAGRGGAVR